MVVGCVFLSKICQGRGREGGLVAVGCVFYLGVVR